MDSLNEMHLDKVFEPEKAKEYEARFQVIWDVIVNTNTSMFIVEKVKDFPIDLLFSPLEYRIFLNRVENNFVGYIALMVINLFLDEDKRNVTFETFTKWIKENTCGEISSTVSDCLDKINRSEQVKSIETRLHRMRHKLLAHLDWEHMLNPRELEKSQITYEELRTLVDDAGKIVYKLSIGGGVGLLPPEYDEILFHDANPDIVKILDLIATDSSFLKLPEEQPYLWKGWSDNWTDERKETFNYWRQRIGRDKIAFG